MAKQSHTKRAIAGIVLACAIMSGAILSGVILSAPARALDPGDAIQTRKAVMASIGAHMNGIRAGMAAKNGKLVAGHASALAALAPVLPHLFPKGSGPKAGETRARAEIWENWGDFVATTAALREAANELALVTELGDMAEIATQFGVMAQTGCGACHRRFRTRK